MGNTKQQISDLAYMSAIIKELNEMAVRRDQVFLAYLLDVALLCIVEETRKLSGATYDAAGQGAPAIRAA
jgi:hypothetical protein